MQQMKAILITLVAAVVGCASIQPVLGAESPKAKEKLDVLHTFLNQPDGETPFASLIDVNGTLYGITPNGGANGSFSYGTIYTLDPKTGAEKVVYSFCSQPNCADGQDPGAALFDVNGTLYGTTFYGGAVGGGTVYAFNPQTGAETVLYSFCAQQNCVDGVGPEASLINVNGTLYGTTAAGGTNGNKKNNYLGGTVFSLNLTTGTETVLHSFCSQQNCSDGQQPFAALINVKGTLYGTTFLGGAEGGGTVFSLDPSTGAETVLYAFCSQQNCADGEAPQGIIESKGILYGTTQVGGNAGGGTVFAYDLKTGNETVVYGFCSLTDCTDGLYPLDKLIDVQGTLYGTTVDGGTSNYENCFNIAPGCGTVFAIEPATGTETVLYSLCPKKSCKSGANPLGGLIDVKGTLYGTTGQGGAKHFSGYGTVFALKP
jgi:uncharacterized repeat protein (TIGR03803 family)